MANPQNAEEVALILKQTKMRRDFQERIEGDPRTLFGTDAATGQMDLLKEGKAS